MGNLASITMCSHFFLLMVEIYRQIQILLPSLGTLVVSDSIVGVYSFACSIDSFVCSLSPKVALGGCPWAASSGGYSPEVCQVVLDGDFRHSQDHASF